MKLIHTSDWHLGQHFMGKSRQAEHRAFLAWLIEQVHQHGVDAIIVAGDVFDTGTPPSYARELYNQFVVDLQQTGAALYILGGNHDSVAMLEESASLLAQLNARVIPARQSDSGRHLHVLTTRDGEPGAILCAIPFLRARDMLSSREGQSGEQKQSDLQQAIADFYQSLFDQAGILRQSLGLPAGSAIPIVMTGHLTVVGGTFSESMRDIYIGTLEAFPTAGFPAADYIALGHIHRPQSLGNAGHIRYSGSPIPLSFDEAAQTKSVCLVSFDGTTGTSPQVELLPIPRLQPMQTLRGDLVAIERAIHALKAETDTPVWLDIEVEEQGFLGDIQQKVFGWTEGSALEVLLIRRARSASQIAQLGEVRATLEELQPQEVFEQRLQAENLPEGEGGQAERLRQLFAQLYHQLSVGEDENPPADPSRPTGEEEQVS